MASTSSVSQANAELACNPKRSGENLPAPKLCLSFSWPAQTLPELPPEDSLYWVGLENQQEPRQIWALSSWKSHSKKGRPVLSDSLERSRLAWGKRRAGEVPDPARKGCQIGLPRGGDTCTEA